MSSFSLRSFITAAIASALVLSACGSSSAGPNLDALMRNNVNAGLAPLENGFGFANFGAGAVQEQFDTNDLVTMFGAGACVDGKTENCVPTAQSAAWARMVNDARQSGHCEGLVVQASARFNEKAQPATSQLPLDADVAHGVMRAFATQFLPEVQDAANKWAKKSLVDIVNELTTSLKDGATDYTMGLYTEDGGHAVLPYAVDFSSDTLAVIRVYDSNWPGMDRYVVIDFEKNEWFFSFSGRNPQEDECVWSGGPGDIDLTPLSARISANCPFCGSKTTVTKSMLLIRSTTKNWSIKTSEGTYSPSSDTPVQGVTAKSIRTATCEVKTKLPEFIIGTDSTDMELTLPDDASAYVSNGEAVVEIKTTGKKKRQPIAISGNTITINDPDTTTTISNDNLAVVITAPQAAISLGDNRINVVLTTDTGEESISITPSKPRQEIVVENNNVVVSDATQLTSSVAPVVPEVLKQDAQSVALPPAEERNLNNAQYLEEAKTSASSTTTSVAAGKVSTTTTKPQSSAGNETPQTVAPNVTTPSAPSNSTATTAPTTTAAPTSANVRILIPDGEGGVRFTIGSSRYPDSWGNPMWFDPNDNQNYTDPGQCGPHFTVCNNQLYVVPIGMDFQFTWALYHDVYLFEMQCGSGTPWITPSITYGSGSEVRSLQRCEFNSISSNKTITIRRR